MTGQSARRQQVEVVRSPAEFMDKGPSAMALSTARPVMTMSAPAASAAAIGKAPV